MKNLLLLFALLGLAVGASAQEIVNFSDLPDASSPSPIPDGYGNLNWAGFFYVDPYEWAGAGPGFKHGPLGKDVGFSPYVCGGGSLCYGSINSTTGFQLISVHAAAGYASLGPGGSPLLVTAYYKGKYIGSQRFMMTTDVQELDFPPIWGIVTQVVFQGSVVLYDVTAYTLGH
jgi:hypothetical protein